MLSLLMKRIASAASVWFSKILSFALRFSGRAGGTTLPGYLLEKRFPFLLKELVAQIPKKIIITGTNGKTTTQALIVKILRSAGYKVISNISGANLSRGILSTLLNTADLTGKHTADYAVFEIEEGTFPRIADAIDADTIVVTNLFRDQLDAYGEINKTREYITDAIKKSPKAKVILNVNDPNVYKIGTQVKNEKFYFGLEEKYLKEFLYEGKYVLPKSENVNKKMLYATNIKVDKDLSTSFEIVSPKKKIKILKFASPGLYNVYNVLASTLTTSLEKIPLESIKNDIESFAPAFGRGEESAIVSGDKKVNFKLMLIKNPAGFTITLKTLSEISAKHLLILINDNTADGKDVSWLWDSQIELLNKFALKFLTISGIRAKDMLLRVKYALDKKIRKKSSGKYISGDTEIACDENIKSSLEYSLSKLKNGETLYILPTYTAMLEVRKILEQKTNLKKFWK